MKDDSKVWFITGASRGLGLNIAKAVLDKGHKVIATARNAKTLQDVLPESESVLHVALDVTRQSDALNAVSAALEKLGCIDVLVNNAGFGHLGVFEEIAPSSIENQFHTNVFGLMNVTRAILPTMRQQKSGQIYNISSIGGALGFDGASIYCATKFAVEGFSECMKLELAQFNIDVAIVEPGFFRTDFLDEKSIKYAGNTIDDYAEYAKRTQEIYDANNHKQLGDPYKLGEALVKISNQGELPTRYAAGSDAYEYITAGNKTRQNDLLHYKELTLSTDIKE